VGDAALPASHAPAPRMPLAGKPAPAGRPFGPPTHLFSLKEKRMKTRRLELARRNVRIAMLGSAVLLALGATATVSHAATKVDRKAAQQQYRADVQYCNSGQATQPRAVCQREAQRAYQENLRGTLDVPVVAAGNRSTDSTGATTGMGTGMSGGSPSGTSTGTGAMGNSGSTTGTGAGMPPSSSGTGMPSTSSGTGMPPAGSTSGTGMSGPGMAPSSGAGSSSGTPTGSGSTRGMGDSNTGSTSSGNTGSTTGTGAVNPGTSGAGTSPGTGR
jgi:hypothetical protein